MSLFDYAEFAGRNTISATEVCEYDRNHNPKNSISCCYDLVRDGACDGHRIAILDCYGAFHSYSCHNHWNSPLGDVARGALRQKGFELIFWNQALMPGERKFPPTGAELKAELNTCSQVWIWSSNGLTLTEDLCAIIKDFFDAGHGVYIWGYSDPYNVDANFLLNYMLPGVILSGYLRGGSEREIREATAHGRTGFHPHLITTGLAGLVNMYSASALGVVTLPQSSRSDCFTEIVTSSQQTLVTVAYEHEGKRALVDGGLARLFCMWPSGGNDRYIANAAAWLVNIEALKKQSKIKMSTYVPSTGTHHHGPVFFATHDPYRDGADKDERRRKDDDEKGLRQRKDAIEDEKVRNLGESGSKKKYDAECENGCGHPQFGKYKTCCTHCKGPDGPHARGCKPCQDEKKYESAKESQSEIFVPPIRKPGASSEHFVGRNPGASGDEFVRWQACTSCANGCGRVPFRQYPTCCTHCKGRDGPHHMDCDQRAKDEEVRRHIRTVFTQAEDQARGMSFKRFRGLLRKLFPEDQMEGIFAACDINADGLIEIDELLAWLYSGSVSENTRKEVIASFDI